MRCLFHGDFLTWPCIFFWWCVSCSAADRLRFCSFSGERIYIILALIFFLPKQRAVRIVICLLHICSIICTICPVVFLYMFIFNFQDTFKCWHFLTSSDFPVSWSTWGLPWPTKTINFLSHDRKEAFLGQPSSLKETAIERGYILSEFEPQIT